MKDNQNQNTIPGWVGLIAIVAILLVILTPIVYTCIRENKRILSYTAEVTKQKHIDDSLAKRTASLAKRTAFIRDSIDRAERLQVSENIQNYVRLYGPAAKTIFDHLVNGDYFYNKNVFVNLCDLSKQYGVSNVLTALKNNGRPYDECSSYTFNGRYKNEIEKWAVMNKKYGQKRVATAFELCTYDGKADYDRVETILERCVRIGYTKDQCRFAWGAPERINRTTNRYGVSEQWCYGSGNYLYFDDGILTTIQN